MYKEYWAEIVRYINLGGSWDQDGAPINTIGIFGQGNPKIINIAQKAFRKNRQTVDALPAYSGNYETITVQTQSEISSKLSEQYDSLSEYYYGETIFGYSCNFTLTRAAYYYTLADTLGWSTSELADLHTEAEAEAALAIEVMP